MDQVKAKWVKTRQELADKYFSIFGELPTAFNTYAKGNLGIISLLSDIQEILDQQGSLIGREYWINILNDIKSILIQDQKGE